MRTTFLVLFYIVLVILISPFVLFCLLTGLKDPLLAVGLWAMRAGRRILGIKVEVSGLDRIDARTAYVFMPNHLSFLDGPLVMMLIPGAARVILKKSVLRLPVVGGSGCATSLSAAEAVKKFLDVRKLLFIEDK
jgi:1-acyl-sn-glycerol-3-phosphate acyltransferase